MASPSTRFRLSLAVALTVVAVPGPAHADDPRRADADRLFAEGMARHQRGDEDAALGKFKEAYQAFPRPNTLMAIAREEHLLGLCVAAVRHYREALGNAMLHPENRVLAREYVAAHEQTTNASNYPSRRPSMCPLARS